MAAEIAGWAFFAALMLLVVFGALFYAVALWDRFHEGR